MNKKLSKFVKTISAMALVSMLHCNVNATTFEKKADVKFKTPTAKVTSGGYKTLNYKKAADQYKADTTLLKEILNFDYSKLTRNETEEAMAKFAGKIGAFNLELTRALKALEYNNWQDAGIDVESAQKIFEERGVNTDLKTNNSLQRGYSAHALHILFDSINMINYGADQSEIRSYDEIDSKNEFFEIKKDGKRNLLEDSTNFTNKIKQHILTNCEYESILVNNPALLTKINNLFVKLDAAITECKTASIDQLINQGTELLPASMGTEEMRQGIMTAYANQRGFNKLINKTKISEINPELITKTKSEDNKFVFNPIISVNTNNLETGFGVGLDVNKQFNDDWGISFGGMYNVGFGTGENKGNTSHEIMANANAERNINKNHAVSAGLNAGLRFDDKGVSTPFGVQGDWTLKINEEFEVNFGVAVGGNAQNKNMNVSGSIGATYKTKNKNKNKKKEESAFSVVVKGGKIIDLGKENVIKTPGNTQGNAPIYGGDQVQQPGETIDKGDITEGGEKPINISDYSSQL